MNPVFQADVIGEGGHPDGHFYVGKWYFYDETWVRSYGPFNTEQEANEACNKYAETI